MELSLNQARVIVDSCPPDTVVWNCWSAEDMVTAAAEVADANALVAVICEREGYDIERRLGAQDCGEKLDRLIEETRTWKDALPEAVRRAVKKGLAAV